MSVAPQVAIDSLVYVDDIAMAGGVNVIEKVGEKLNIMEEEKKFTFNNDPGKTNYLMIKTGYKEEKEPVIKVRKGKVERTKEYRYLGNWINEKGNEERQIEELEKRGNVMATEVMTMVDERKLGKMSTEAAM